MTFTQIKSNVKAGYNKFTNYTYPAVLAAALFLAKESYNGIFASLHNVESTSKQTLDYLKTVTDSVKEIRRDQQIDSKKIKILEYTDIDHANKFNRIYYVLKLKPEPIYSTDPVLSKSDIFKDNVN